MNADIALLQSMPGIGPLSASSFVATIDEEGRFAKGSHLASYLGLTPGEKSTGGKQNFTAVTKAGRGQLRTLLIQACWSHIRNCPQSNLSLRFERLCKSKPKQVAIVATARRMVWVLLSMLKNGCKFEINLGASRHPMHEREQTPYASDRVASVLRATQDG